MRFSEFKALGMSEISHMLNNYKPSPIAMDHPCKACGGYGYLLRASIFNRVNEEECIKDKNGWDVQVCDPLICPCCSGTGVCQDYVEKLRG